MSISLQRFSERSQLLRCHKPFSPGTQGGHQALLSCPLYGCAAHRAWFSRVQLVVSRLVTARPVPGVSAQKMTSALVPATVPVWVTEVPASAWDYGDACVQRPYELEENCEAGFPNLQMGKVRPRQGLPKAQDFSARGALCFLGPTGDPLQPTPATFLQK